MRMPTCTNGKCHGKMHAFYLRDTHSREIIGYMCKECNSYIFIKNVGKELDVVYRGLNSIKSKNKRWG